LLGLLSRGSSNGLKTAGACRPPAAGADVPANARYRDHVLSHRPDRDENDQGKHEGRKHRQYRQYRRCYPH
jgi:hypothetical protein